jgi:hypothetical protein
MDAAKTLELIETLCHSFIFLEGRLNMFLGWQLYLLDSKQQQPSILLLSKLG